MTCDCKTKIEAALTERFRSATPAAADHRVELQGYGLSVGGGTLTLRPFMRYIYAADYPLKKGGSRCRSKSSVLAFSYCPFCGVKVGGEVQ